jgi:hypothetical protein
MAEVRGREMGCRMIVKADSGSDRSDAAAAFTGIALRGDAVGGAQPLGMAGHAGRPHRRSALARPEA